MGDVADLSLPAIAELVHEFCERLDLTYVTLVGNDTGGALVQLLAASVEHRHPKRICLVSCEAFENIPPGLTGKTVVAVGKLPPTLFGVFMQQMRVRPLRRLAELLPNSSHVEIADARTLIPLDQPAALALAIRDFLAR
jgi:pimeloyl-ACP methyl ester carboxylesterase